MKIIFSEHALFQIRERNLSKNLLIETVENPDTIVLQLDKRSRAQKIIEKEGKKYVLIVIYDMNGKNKEIVTAFLTTKFKKYL